MYVQRAHLPHAIAAGSFDSPLTALTANTQSNARKSMRENVGSQLCSEGSGRGWRHLPPVLGWRKWTVVMVCYAEYPSGFLSMERSSLHTLGAADNTLRESKSLAHPFSTSCPKKTVLAMKESSALQSQFLFNKSRAGWLHLSTLLHTHLTQVFVTLSLKHNPALTQRALHGNECSVIH